MKKIFLLLAAAALSGLASAQSRHQFTLGAGLAHSTRKEVYDHGDQKMGLSPFVELGYGYALNPQMVLGSNLAFRNYRFSGTYDIINGRTNYLYDIYGLEHGFFFRHEFYRLNQFSLSYRVGLFYTYFTHGSLDQKQVEPTVQEYPTQYASQFFLHESRWNAGAKIGLEAHVNERWSLGLEYSRHFAGTSDLGFDNSYYGKIALALRYHF